MFQLRRLQLSELGSAQMLLAVMRPLLGGVVQLSELGSAQMLLSVKKPPEGGAVPG